MHALVAAGADVIELGVPFSDPMADGPVIQRASERALAQHVGLKDVLGAVAAFRRTDTVTPVVLMGYANPIEAMGVAAFADRAREAGVDGVLVVDYPPEEAGEFAALLDARAMAPIFLLSPTTPEARIAAVARIARGYVYYVSLKGVTGRGQSRHGGGRAQAHGDSPPRVRCRSASASAFATPPARRRSPRTPMRWSSAAASSRKSRPARRPPPRSARARGSPASAARSTRCKSARRSEGDE